MSFKMIDYILRKICKASKLFYINNISEMSFKIKLIIMGAIGVFLFLKSTVTSRVVDAFHGCYYRTTTPAYKIEL